MIADLRDPDNGRVLQLYGTQPAIQIYTGNWLSQGEISGFFRVPDEIRTPPSLLFCPSGILL